jgi:hypothetical protein
MRKAAIAFGCLIVLFMAFIVIGLNTDIPDAGETVVLQSNYVVACPSKPAVAQLLSLTGQGDSKAAGEFAYLARCQFLGRDASFVLHIKEPFEDYWCIRKRADPQCLWVSKSSVARPPRITAPPQHQTSVDRGQRSLWKVVGRVPDGLKPLFVELDRTAVTKREVYEEAVRSLCRPNLCRVMFFAPSDTTPDASSFEAFVKSGGFGYRSLAVWSSNASGSGDFNSWDCDRAGSDGAPLGALCGAGVREAYGAMLALAGRAGMQKACRWPATDDAKIARDYIARMTDPRRKEQFRNEFEGMYNGGNGRPDDLSKCEDVRKRTEQTVLAARKLLRGTAPATSPSKKSAAADNQH